MFLLSFWYSLNLFYENILIKCNNICKASKIVLLLFFFFLFLDKMEVTEVLKLQAGTNNSLIINKAHVRSSPEIVLVFLFLFFFFSQPVFSSALESGRRNINDSDSTLLCDSSADDGWLARGQNGSQGLVTDTHTQKKHKSLFFSRILTTSKHPVF